jgi:hypothetical protein
LETVGQTGRLGQQSPEFKRKVQAQGANAVYVNPSGLADYTVKGFQNWETFVEKARITAGCAYLPAVSDAVADRHVHQGNVPW